jgi:hypothetical protein
MRAARGGHAPKGGFAHEDNAEIAETCLPIGIDENV